MKRFICIFCTAIALVSNGWAGINAANGLYIGGEIGAAETNLPQGVAFHSFLSSILSPFYVRPFIGYRFTDYFALEGGYTNLQDSSQAGGPPEGWQPGPDRYRLYTIDLAGKLIYPFQNGLSLFGKAGVAFAHQSVFNQVYWFSTPSANSTANRLLPLIGAGLSYNFTQQFSADLTATYYQGINPIRNITTIGLGLAYTF